MIIEDIISQHAEEAAFLWLLRDAAVNEPHYTRQDLADLDERINAHLDGLQIAGEPGWRMCLEQLEHEEPGEVFAATWLALALGEDAYIDRVLSIAVGSAELARSATSALAWLDWPAAEQHARQLLMSEDPMRKRIGLGAMAIHRQDPGRELETAVASDFAPLRSRALRAVGELGRADLQKQCEANFDQDDSGCRFWAAHSAALLGSAEAGSRLRLIAESNSPWAERAAELAVRTAPDAALDWIGHLIRNEDRQRVACIAVGALGDPQCVPWLMEMMAVPSTARRAGEAFTSLTGIDLADEKLERDWPDGYESGPSEDALDENVDVDPDENLPWPDHESVGARWAAHGEQFIEGKRYFLGQPIGDAKLQVIMASGRQPCRRAAALEISLNRCDEPLPEWRNNTASPSWVTSQRSR